MGSFGYFGGETRGEPRDYRTRDNRNVTPNGAWQQEVGLGSGVLSRTSAFREAATGTGGLPDYSSHAVSMAQFEKNCVFLRNTKSDFLPIFRQTGFGLTSNFRRIERAFSPCGVLRCATWDVVPGWYETAALAR